MVNLQESVECQASTSLIWDNAPAADMSSHLRHKRAHVTPGLANENFYMHSHFFRTDRGNLKPGDVQSLLSCYEQFSDILHTDIISKDEVNRLTLSFKHQYDDMMKQVNALAAASAKNFITIAVLSFSMHLITAYLLPALLYHGNNRLRKNSQLILRLGRALQPLFILIQTLSNVSMSATSLIIHLANITAQLSNIKFLPNEFFQFLNLIRILSGTQFTEKEAEEIGLYVSNILGNTSARALGSVFAAGLISYLPKLKQEDTPPTSADESEVVNPNPVSPLRSRFS